MAGEAWGRPHGARGQRGEEPCSGKGTAVVLALAQAQGQTAAPCLIWGAFTHSSVMGKGRGGEGQIDAHTVREEVEQRQGLG